MTRYSKTMSEALEEVKEASARADAKRAMSKDKDMKQDPFSKDDDASDDDVKAASKNIIMQLRKSVSMRGNHSVEFANGKQKVDAKIAQAVQDKFNKIKRPADKQKFQDKVAKSYKDLLMALKEQYEMVEEEVELDTIVEGLSMMVKDPNTKKKMQLADGQKVQWNGTNYETDGVTKKQVLVMKDGRKEVVMTKKQVEDSLKNGSFEVTDFGRVSQPEEFELGEGMKMNDPKLLKMFDKLKKGDKIKLKTSSTISKGKDFVEYIVKSKNTVNKGRVEKITLATVGNEGAVKKFLYKRDGTVGFAIGDMGASIDDIKEDTNMDAYVSRISTDEGAAADARRDMRRDPDMRSKGDTEDDSASDKDVEKAANHIIMQLRKSVSMRGQKDVEFASGKQKVPPQVAQKILDMYNKQRTSADKSKFQMKIAKSYKDLLTTVKGR